MAAIDTLQNVRSLSQNVRSLSQNSGAGVRPGFFLHEFRNRLA